MASTAMVSSAVSGSLARYLRQASNRKSRAWSRLGLNMFFLVPEPGFVLEATQVEHDALRALGLARHAGVAAVQDQPVMGVLHEFRRHHLQQLLFDRDHILARRQAHAVADAEDMRIDGHG